MSRNILLINPWIHDFAAYDFWIKPLGLLYLGGLLRRNNHQVSLIDCLDPYHPDMLPRPSRHAYGRGKFFRQIIEKPACLKMISKNYCRYGMKPELFRQELKNHANTDLILITSMMTYWYPGVFEAIRIIKQELPLVPVVLGGKYATLCYDHAVRYSGADYVIAGAGEKQIMELLRAFFNEEPLFMPDENNLDSHPYPAFDLISKIVQLPLTTSRGCPYRCSYCASRLFNRKFRRRDPIQVADEIEHWQKQYAVMNFCFYDDALLVNPDEMIVPLLSEIKKRNLSCQFHCPNGLHLREVTDECASLMKRSGFETIRFGFETSDALRQRLTGGKTTNDDFLRAVGCLKNAGYRSEDIGVYLLCGLPGQSPEEVEESIRYVRENGARPLLAEYSPIPGTALWETSVKSSRFPIDREPLFQNNTLLPCRDACLTDERFAELKKLARQPLP